MRHEKLLLCSGIQSNLFDKDTKTAEFGGHIMEGSGIRVRDYLNFVFSGTK